MRLMFAYLGQGLTNNYVYAAEGNCSRQGQCKSAICSLHTDLSGYDLKVYTLPTNEVA